MTTSQNSIRATAAVKHPYLDLFLISFLILFFELACIRWFGGMVVYLTFLPTSFSLRRSLACPWDACQHRGAAIGWTG